MQRWTRSFLAAGLAAVLVAPAMAQRPDGQRGRGGFTGGFGGGGRVTVFSALRSEAVQKELAISEDQKTKLTELGEKVSTAQREAFGGFGGGGGGERPSREEMEKRMAEAREKTDKVIADNKPALAAILSGEQATRLDQIVLQAKGGEALNEKDVQAKLTVTEEQKSKLASVTKEFGEKERGVFQRPEGGGGGNRPDPEAMRAAMEKRNAITKEKDAALVAVLTPAQAEQFDLMKGKEFADLDSVRRGGFGGRGPGGGGPGGGGGTRGGDRPTRPATEN